MDNISAIDKFQELISNPQFIVALGVWDPYTARVAEALGVECVHIGGYQLGIGHVVPEPLLSLTEIARTCRYVTAAVRIPVIVDAGAGFGEPLHVMRTVKEFEAAGAVAIHIEDQIYPKRVHYHKGIEHIISEEEMVQKIKAAVRARRNPNFVIIARTDAMATGGFAEGVKRANLFLEAGADMVMVFPNSIQEARQAPREIKGRICTVNGEGNRLGRPVFSKTEYEEMGYKLATYPTALLCPVTQEMKRVINHLNLHGTSGLPQDQMITWRKECEDLIGLEEYYKVESDTVEHPPTNNRK
ncbi:MAG: isocitrate lyase/PEP mutase family protein [Gammaproteobacteria bacterium]|nr:isocitrate lyase/PEP mutase family protein [Gammaproteobacteria bacterium]